MIRVSREEYLARMAAGAYTKRTRHGFYCIGRPAGERRHQKKGGDFKMIGVVKWFNAQRGFGFIAGDDGNDYFAHFTGISGTGYRNLEAGQRVEFTAQAENKGLRAINIVVLDDAPSLVFKG